MFCSSCGATVAEGTAFCGACGRPIVGYSIGQSSAQPGALASPGVAAHAGELRYAGFWLRFVAHIIDGLVMLLVFGVFVALTIGIVGVGTLHELAESMRFPQEQPPVFPVAFIGIFWSIILFSVIVSWLYFALMESSEKQGTLGKMALSLPVTDMQGNRISFGRATGRYFAKFVTGMVPFAIGYIMAGFTQKKQALHDMIASCLVLRRD